MSRSLLLVPSSSRSSYDDFSRFRQKGFSLSREISGLSVPHLTYSEIRLEEGEKIFMDSC